MKTVHDYEVAIESIIEKYADSAADGKTLNAAIVLAGRVLSEGSNASLKDDLHALIASLKNNHSLHADVVESVRLTSEAVLLGVKIALESEHA